MAASFGKSLSGFLDFLASERRASDHTVDAYRRDLSQLERFVLDRRGEGIDVSEIDVYLLRQWLGELTRVVATASVARKIAPSKAFFRYLPQRGALTKDPAAELSSPKVRRPLPTFVGVDAAREVVEAPDGATPEGMRDRAMLEVLYGSGLRVSELAGLDVGDLDLRGATARVRGKGKKERTVPLGRASIRPIENWPRHRDGMVRPGAAGP